jgi:hypothetical protein
MNKLLLLMLFVSTGSYAGLFDNKLQAYDCTSNACDSTCTKREGFFLEFKTDKVQRFVMMTAHNGSNSNSIALQNCSIIDSKNWSCDDKTNNGTTHMSMTNGIFKSDTSILAGKFYQSFVCAK